MSDVFADSDEDFENISSEGNFSESIPDVGRFVFTPGDYHFKVTLVTKKLDDSGQTKYNVKSVCLGAVGKDPGAEMGESIFTNLSLNKAGVWRAVNFCRDLNLPKDDNGEYQFNNTTVVGRLFIGQVVNTKSGSDVYNNIKKEKPALPSTEEADINYEASK